MDQERLRPFLQRVAVSGLEEAWSPILTPGCQFIAGQVADWRQSFSNAVHPLWRSYGLRRTPVLDQVARVYLHESDHRGWQLAMNAPGRLVDLLALLSLPEQERDRL